MVYSTDFLGFSFRLIETKKMFKKFKNIAKSINKCFQKLIFFSVLKFLDFDLDPQIIYGSWSSWIRTLLTLLDWDPNITGYSSGSSNKSKMFFEFYNLVWNLFPIFSSFSRNSRIQESTEIWNEKKSGFGYIQKYKFCHEKA